MRSEVSGSVVQRHERGGSRQSRTKAKAGTSRHEWYISVMKNWHERWEVNAAIVCSAIMLLVVGIEYGCDCLTNRYPLAYSTILGLASGVLGTVVVLWFQRSHRIEELKRRYLPLAGVYKRVDIGQDNTPDIENIRSRNVDLPIELNYAGGNAFRISASYWSDLKCKVDAHIEFVESNKMIATGRYRYVEGTAFVNPPHFGTYVVYRFKEDDGRLLVLYQHIFPRMKDNNPDANRGWEIWEKDPRVA